MEEKPKVSKKQIIPEKTLKKANDKKLLLANKLKENLQRRKQQKV